MHAVHVQRVKQGSTEYVKMTSCFVCRHSSNAVCHQPYITFNILNSSSSISRIELKLSRNDPDIFLQEQVMLFFKAIIFQGYPKFKMAAIYKTHFKGSSSLLLVLKICMNFKGRAAQEV